MKSKESVTTHRKRFNASAVQTGSKSGLDEKSVPGATGTRFQATPKRGPGRPATFEGPMVTRCISLPKTLDKRLRSAAKRHKKSFSAFIAKTVELYLMDFDKGS